MPAAARPEPLIASAIPAQPQWNSSAEITCSCPSGSEALRWIASRPPKPCRRASPPAPAPSNNNGGGETAAAQAPEALGYPSFATNNTTRIGGSDPAANAAAVALAVFPSTTASQRPAAVALAGEEDWAGAIAA